MDSIRKININEAPKGLRLFFMLLPLLGYLLIDTKLDNDFYFLYPTGEYIVNNGFPVKDILSMHGNMSIIVQQWLTDVIYYFIYSRLGTAGMIAFVFLCYTAFCVIMYRLTKLITDNHFVSCIVASFADIFVAVTFMKTRPQAMTLVLIALELLMLEKYVKTKSIKPLFVLPVISLALINLHCSMWFMMFVFALPYAFSALKFKLRVYSQEPCCKFLPLLICGAVCFALGFVNPYGLKAITYVFTSFGIDDINAIITEMRPLTLTDSVGAVYFISIFVMLAITVASKKRNFTPRFVLLFAGTAVLALMNYKSLAYFYIGGFTAFSYFLKDFTFDLKITEGKRTKSEKIKLAVLAGLIAAMLIGLVGYIALSPKNADSNAEIGNASETADEDIYGDLDNIAQILDSSGDEVVLYTGFNTGQYMEFKGYRPYIDGRAELFLKANNGKFDYFKEYIDFTSGKTYYKDFLNKYNFNYIIIEKDSAPIEELINRDSDYELLYESETVLLYAKK